MASSSKKGDDTIEWMGMKLAKKDMKVCKDCKKKDQTSMIEKAVRANHLVCLNLAIQNPPGRKTIDPRRDKFELERGLFVAVERNQPKCIQLIMGTWGDACSTNAEGQTPVLIAAEKGFLDCLKVLCECDTIETLFDDYDEDGEIVAAARSNGHEECVKFLKAKGARDPLDDDNSEDELEEEETDGDDSEEGEEDGDEAENNQDGKDDGEPDSKTPKIE